VGLRFHTCAHEGLQKDLRRGITDLAFLLTESIQASDLGVEAVGFESIVMVTRPDAPLAAKEVVHTRDLEGETMLLSKVDCSYRRMLQQMLAQEKVRLDTTLEFNSVAALKECVMEGVGITVLPEVAVEKEINSGKLKKVPWVNNEFEVAVLMIWYKERWLSPALMAFMDAVREGLRDG
jgi:DNA-binding transcriptional LysR family regulator